jgi:hypothetical protein
MNERKQGVRTWSLQHAVPAAVLPTLTAPEGCVSVRAPTVGTRCLQQSPRRQQPQQPLAAEAASLSSCCRRIAAAVRLAASAAAVIAAASGLAPGIAEAACSDPAPAEGLSEESGCGALAAPRAVALLHADVSRCSLQQRRVNCLQRHDSVNVHHAPPRAHQIRGRWRVRDDVRYHLAGLQGVKRVAVVAL